MYKKAVCMVWIVSGPSGSGKTSLCRALLLDGAWKKKLLRSVSYTTRPARRGEKDGKDYHHVSEKEFLGLKKHSGFLESEKIFGFYYGTPKKSLADARKEKKDLILCIDVKGARTIKRALKDNVDSIFILAPKLKVLTERLQKRSTEGKKDIQKRLERVKMELSYARDYDYIIVNDDFDKALGEIKSILTAKRCEVRRGHNLRNVMT
jgi:guanylate kinase